MQLAHTDQDIHRCFAVMAQLRPHLQAATFVATVRQMMTEGYQLAYLQGPDGEVGCVAGFRITHNLFLGKNLYVDDLVTDEAHRSQGLGATMFIGLEAYARQHGCAAVHLDSGTQRHDAHRFYLRQGMHINCFHFAKTLGS